MNKEILNKGLNDGNKESLFLKECIDEKQKLKNSPSVQRPKKTKSLKDIVFSENYSLRDCGWEH